MEKTSKRPTDVGDFQWISVKESTSSPRWKAYAVAIVLTMLIVIAAPTGIVGAEVNSEFTAENVGPLITNNGHIDELTVAPEGEINYYGLESEPESITVEVAIRSDATDGWETVHTTVIGGDEELGLEGTVEYSLPQIDLFAESSLTSNDFRPPNGETSETDIDIRVKAIFAGAGGGTDVVASGEDTYTVTVENVHSGGGVSGTANTGGSG